MATGAHFDPDRLAYFESAGWRAYYDRDWLRVLRLMLALFGEQFHIPFPRSLLAAYYITRASIAWAPVQHDEDKVLSYFGKFYRLARRYSDLPFDPECAAQLELEYWVVHRQLLGQSDQAAFVDTMTRLHSEVFGLSADQVRLSAERRVLAAMLVDRITSRLATNVEADWASIEDALRECYRSIRHELDAQTVQPEPTRG